MDLMEGKLIQYRSFDPPSIAKQDKTAVILFDNGFTGYFWDIYKIMSESMIGKIIQVKLIAVGQAQPTFFMDEKYEIKYTNFYGWDYQCKGRVVDIESGYIVDVGGIHLLLDLAPVDVIDSRIGDFISFKCRIDIGEIKSVTSSATIPGIGF